MADIKILDILDKLNNPMTHASLFSGIGASEAVHFADRLIEALYHVVSLHLKQKNGKD